MKGKNDMKLRIFLTLFCATIFMFLSCTREPEDDPVKHYPPDKPQILSAEANNSNEITVSWEEDASENDAADYYYLFKSTDSLGKYSSVSTTGEKIYKNEKIATNLNASTKYYFKLVAANRYGASDTSDIVSQKTLLDTPKNLKTTFLPINELVLEWDEVVDNESVLRGIGGEGENGAEKTSVKYKIYSSQKSSGEYSFVDETNETRMKFLNLDDEKTYYYKVSAVDSDEREGEKSDYISVNVLGDLPNVPQGLAANLIIDNYDNGKISANLTWNRVSGADSYKVYRSTSPQISYELYAPTTNNSMLISELKAGTKYYFKVSSINSNGESEKSQGISVQTPQPTKPNTPTGLSAEYLASDTVIIMWNPVSTATGYYVYYASSQNGTYQRSDDIIQYNGIILEGWSKYGSVWYFKVSAVNDYGESDLSLPIRVTTTKN
jgi:fibronectin type 3 domain-containing protein